MIKKREIETFFISMLLVGTIFGGITFEVRAPHPPLETWHRIHDGGDYDNAHAVAIDSNNNIIVTGASYLVVLNGDDFFTIKYDPTGLELWNRTYDGIGSYCVDISYGVAVDSNDNIVVVGFTDSGSNENYYTIKYDASGTVIWSKEYDGGNPGDVARDVAIDSYNNIIVTGNSVLGLNGDYYTIKYDSNGNELWNRSYDGGSGDVAYGIAVDSQDNIIVTGCVGDVYVYTIKYDNGGNEIWNRSYNSGGAESGRDVAVDSQDNIIVTGMTTVGVATDFYTIKYDSNGNELWNRSYDGGDSEIAHGVAVNSNDNIVVTGEAMRSGDKDYYTLAYSPDGSILGNQIYDGGGHDESHDIAIDSYNNIIITGESWISGNKDYYTIKYGPSEFDLQPLVVYVDDNYTSATPGWGADHFDTMQDGIDAVAENGTVYVYNGTYYENVIINKAINLVGENKDTTIIDGYFSGSTVQITTDWVNISGFKIQNSTSDGIHLYYSQNTTILGNMITDNDDFGIYLYESSYNNITQNIIIQNGIYGISLRGSRNFISKNNIENNTENGIYMGEWSSNNIIVENTIENNNGYGLHISSWSNNNLIYHNNFINNSLSNTENAYDMSFNTWDDGYPSGGNYWSNYDEPSEGAWDNNSDGIADTPYDIPPIANSQDLYPLMQPWGSYTPPIDYILITFGCSPNEVPDQSLSTNFTLECYASAFNNIHGFIGFVSVNWALFNSGTNASINGTYGESVELSSGWYDGMATLSIDDGNSHTDTVIFTIDHSVFSMFIGCGWNLIGWWQDYDTDAPTLGQYIPSCKTVCRFRVETQMYQTHVVGIPYNEFTITRGMGLFIYTTEASIWDGEG